MAKPIIDILGVAESLAAIETATPRLVAIVFEAMGEYGEPGRRYFRLSMAGARSHHPHVFAAGALPIARHLIFRDYLIAYPEVARAYPALKAGLPVADYQ